MTDDVEDFLEHFGVKGMHWGTRRAKTPATTSNYKEADRNRDHGHGGDAAVKTIAEGIDKHGLSLEEARARNRAITKKASDLEGIKSIGNSVSAGLLSGAIAHVTLSTAEAVAHSPATEAALSRVFANSPYGVKVAVVKSVIGARKASSVANDPMVKMGVASIAGYQGVKTGYSLSEKHYRRRATKIVDRAAGRS